MWCKHWTSTANKQVYTVNVILFSPLCPSCLSAIYDALKHFVFSRANWYNFTLLCLLSTKAIFLRDWASPLFSSSIMMDGRSLLLRQCSCIAPVWWHITCTIYYEKNSPGHLFISYSFSFSGHSISPSPDVQKSSKISSNCLSKWLNYFPSPSSLADWHYTKCSIAELQCLLATQTESSVISALKLRSCLSSQTIRSIFLCCNDTKDCTLRKPMRTLSSYILGKGHCPLYIQQLFPHMQTLPYNSCISQSFRSLC